MCIRILEKCIGLFHYKIKINDHVSDNVSITYLVDLLGKIKE